MSMEHRPDCSAIEDPKGWWKYLCVRVINDMFNKEYHPDDLLRLCGGSSVVRTSDSSVVQVTEKSVVEAGTNPFAQIDMKHSSKSVNNDLYSEISPRNVDSSASEKNIDGKERCSIIGEGTACEDINLDEDESNTSLVRNMNEESKDAILSASCSVSSDEQENGDVKVSLLEDMHDDWDSEEETNQDIGQNGKDTVKYDNEGLMDGRKHVEEMSGDDEDSVVDSHVWNNESCIENSTDQEEERNICDDISSSELELKKEEPKVGNHVVSPTNPFSSDEALISPSSSNPFGCTGVDIKGERVRNPVPLPGMKGRSLSSGKLLGPTSNLKHNTNRTSKDVPCRSPNGTIPLPRREVVKGGSERIIKTTLPVSPVQGRASLGPIITSTTAAFSHSPVATSPAISLVDYHQQSVYNDDEVRLIVMGFVKKEVISACKSCNFDTALDKFTSIVHENLRFERSVKHLFLPPLDTRIGSWIPTQSGSSNHIVFYIKVTVRGMGGYFYNVEKTYKDFLRLKKKLSTPIFNIMPSGLKYKFEDNSSFFKHDTEEVLDERREMLNNWLRGICRLPELMISEKIHTMLFEFLLFHENVDVNRLLS